MRFLRQSLVGLFLLSLTLGLLVYAGALVRDAVEARLNDEPRVPEARERVFAVNVTPARFETVTPVLTAFGEVQSRRTLELRSAIEGTLIDLAPDFVEGGRVEAGEVLARITCSPSGNVILQRYVDPRSPYNRTMTIRTETTTRSLQAPVDPEGQNMFAAVIPGRDPLLDAMALTKGRFALELADAPTLYLPAWAEVTRVIEDCR